MQQKVIVREAARKDQEAIREIYKRAFPEGESKAVATLALDLLGEEERSGTIGLVAEIDGLVVAHAAFSPVTSEANAQWAGYILAPLGVVPTYQKRGAGSALVETGIARLSEAGVQVLFVYGDPAYYGRFGFSADVATNYTPPYALQYPFGWQAIVLNDIGSSGPALSISCVPALRDPGLW